MGTPKDKYKQKWGSEPKIQVNDAFANLSDLQPWVIMERDAIAEEEQNAMTVSIKADQEVKMGLIQDIKLELRRAQALKINYSAQPAGSKEAIYKTKY